MSEPQPQLATIVERPEWARPSVRRLWACPFMTTFHRTRRDAQRGRRPVVTAFELAAAGATVRDRP